MIAPTATVRVRFIAEDADSGSIIEAAIDDFRVTTSGCSDQCAGDATGNGVVDLDDLLITLGAFGRCLADDGYTGSADFDLDGCITLDDLLIVLGSFGGACP